MNPNKKMPEFSEVHQRIVACDKRIDALIDQELVSRNSNKTRFFRRPLWWEIIIVFSYFFAVQPFIQKATMVTLDYFFGSRS